MFFFMRLLFTYLWELEMWRLLLFIIVELDDLKLIRKFVLHIQTLFIRHQFDTKSSLTISTKNLKFWITTEH